MVSDDFKLTSKDNIPLHVYSWGTQKTDKAKGAVQVAHGMAEHGERYGRLAQRLVGEGYLVYANDHRGHGKTAGSVENLGYFADENGWDLVVEDMHLLTQTIKTKHPDLPVFLLGHSMGSFLARDYISRFSKDINGVILSGTSGDPGFFANIGIVLAVLFGVIKGKKNKNPLMHKLSFGGFNKAFKPARTEFDWLSRDKEEVDKYINDPYCGTVFTSGFYYDLLKGIKKINQPDRIATIDKNLPILIFSGDRDPVGKNTKGVLALIKTYREAGIQDVSYMFYKDGRHEMLNEINREEVTENIIHWLDSHVDL